MSNIQCNLTDVTDIANFADDNTPFALTPLLTLLLHAKSEISAKSLSGDLSIKFGNETILTVMKHNNGETGNQVNILDISAVAA